MQGLQYGGPTPQGSVVNAFLPLGGLLKEHGTLENCFAGTTLGTTNKPLDSGELGRNFISTQFPVGR